MGIDFVFGLPTDDKGNTGIFGVCLPKMVHLAPVRDKVTGKQATQLFLDSVFRYHGLPETIVSDRDPRFTGAFWDTLFQLLETKLTMSTADHPQTDGQTERCSKMPSAVSVREHLGPGRISFLWLSLHSTMRYTHHRGADASIIGVGEARKAFSSQVSAIEPESLKRQMSSVLDDRLTLISRVRGTMTSAQDKRKEYSDKISRGNLNVFKEGDLVLLDTKPLPLKVVISVDSNKLKHRVIGLRGPGQTWHGVHH
ncbi:LOW QUALITY PROTEIN: Pol protein [Phytophthora palmivora]|uniref:Pol protein n=1 Tax=Phytophthora palmivora TaxID=4796 RepID=A0A2P4X427_9STRA|nr:LOW QUALITY PROTEIN: Pol protein [Phytophthora palmivora]